MLDGWIAHPCTEPGVFLETFDQSLWSERDRPPQEPDSDSFMHTRTAAFPADVLLRRLICNKLDNKTHKSIVVSEVKMCNFHKGSLKIIYFVILKLEEEKRFS